MSSTRPPIEDLKLRMPDDLDVRHCYRHPDRETGVSCSNCGRPICHECMIPAAVGFRCPDCVAQQRRHAGRGKYLVLYLVSGFAGNVLVFLLGPAYVVTVGASTAIFGIFGALFVYVFRNRSAYPNQVLGQLAFWMALNLVITFTNSGISWQGHIGGLIGGIVTLELLTRSGRRPLRTPLTRTDVWAVLAVLAVLVAIVVWRTHAFVA